MLCIHFHTFPFAIMSSTEPNGQALNGQDKTTLEADIAQLSALLSEASAEGDADVAELLQRIDTADGMAQGVESKLDNMLENLDNLLASLESQADVGDVVKSSTVEGLGDEQT
jgi:hypothetical protein